MSGTSTPLPSGSLRGGSAVLVTLRWPRGSITQVAAQVQMSGAAASLRQYAEAGGPFQVSTRTHASTGDIVSSATFELRATTERTALVSAATNGSRVGGISGKVPVVTANTLGAPPSTGSAIERAARGAAEEARSIGRSIRESIEGVSTGFGSTLAIVAVVGLAVYFGPTILASLTAANAAKPKVKK